MEIYERKEFVIPDEGQSTEDIKKYLREMGLRVGDVYMEGDCFIAEAEKSIKN